MTLLDAARCPLCAGSLATGQSQLTCLGCGHSYPRLGGIPVLLRDSAGYLGATRQQLLGLEKNAQETIRKIELELESPEVLPSTRERCESMIQGIRRQIVDVKGLLDPILPPFTATAGMAPNRRGVPATVEYLHYLYRDWGHRTTEDDENPRTLARLLAVLGGKLGRTLILGSGACRLGYDLYWSDDEAEFVALDLDPVLSVAAHQVLGGATLTVCEANLEIHEQAQSLREWVLVAPRGPVDPDRFQLLIADALEPPFKEASFDTVVTPWFIDEGPADVRELISTVARSLRPGGRWINSGPLLYHDDVAITRRFGREELFDLASRADLDIEAWRTDSEPYLVSALNGRGRIEWLLTFAARKTESSRPSGCYEDPPGWLLFNHLPVPVFPGHSLFWSETPAIRYIVSAIDGHRTVRDIAMGLSIESGRSDVSLHDLCVAVRECLADVHPAARR